MNLGLIMNMFVRDFRKQRKRITLTLIALIWGTMSIMLLLAFGEGFHRQMMINKRGLGEGIGVLWGGQTTIPFKGLGKGRPIRFMAEDVAYIKERVPAIGRISGEYHRWGAKVKYKDKVLSEHLTGINQQFEQMRNHIPEAGGRMLNVRDIELQRRVTFLGDELKRKLFGDEDAVGKTMLIDGTPFLVIGVMQPKMQMGSYSGSDENKLSIPWTSFKTIYGRRNFNNIVYQAVDPQSVALIEPQLFRAMGAKYKFDPADDNALSIWDVAASEKEFDNMLFGMKVFLGIIGGLTLIIASVGVANIMYVAIKERTREIGIKMAVGARKAIILWQFLLEALLIVFVGGVGGITISYVLTEGFKRVPIESEVMDFMGRPTISLEIGLIVVIILGVMGLFAGLFPALRAASVSPVESLRYE